MASGKRFFQKFGSAAMTPIAVLPAAALLLALGHLTGLSALDTAGNVLIANIGLIFAVGLSIGLADDASIAGFSGVISYSIITGVASLAAEASLDMGIIAGITAALITAPLYSRFHTIKLHPWLSFFGGRRFVPIITAIASVPAGFLLGYLWPHLQGGIVTLSQLIAGAGGLGSGIYGALERLLLPLGMHHVLNAFILGVMGEYTTPTGQVVSGEVFRFLAGDPTAGHFLAGAYPIKLFGLPAACYAMYRAALPGQRDKVKGLLLAAAATSVLTGITEPVEFAFLFTAPLLYGLHILLTGSAFWLSQLLGFRHGFGSSAGLLEYFLNNHLADKPWLLLPLGLLYAGLYYLTFTGLIRLLNLNTPGRQPEEEASSLQATPAAAREIIAALGGQENILSLNACLTRLRVVVKKPELVKRGTILALGAAGLIGKPQDAALQIVVGTVADELRLIMKNEMPKN